MTRTAGFFFHFYQPPREDPWLGLVANEWSAWPSHDWNERITSECYRAMVAVSLASDGDDEAGLFEPLAESSFDVGPTLHHWLECNAADVDRSLRHQARHVADAPSLVALAAPMVHAILPLARSEDRARLVAWGIADYVARFHERPRGMWLPETAVDLDTLEVLAARGIEYTVLMAGQAVRVRDDDGEWREVDATTLDTSRPYRVVLSEGRSMTVVFGHRELSQRVAFGDLIADGTALADAMVQELPPGDDGLVLLVADGETYGHHHRFGDLGVAWALRRLQRHFAVTTSLGEWLRGRPVTSEVELATASSWSCAHGVERWRSDCGCTTGSSPGWHQGWRRPLRDSLDWLRDELGASLVDELAVLVASVDDTLEDYGQVLAGAASAEEFVTAHAKSPRAADVSSRVLELCEVYRNLLLSFTSCAWFFADPAEIETSIVLRYAAVAIGLARRSWGLDLEAEFVTRLSAVESNRAGVDGAVLWGRVHDHTRHDALSVAAGFAAETLAGGGAARTVRGYWRCSLVGPHAGDAEDVRRVDVTHALTLRRTQVQTRAFRAGTLGLRVAARVGDDDAWTDVRLADLGADVVALTATSWLVSAGSLDYERAIEMLVAELLTRPASDDDAVALVAIASVQRWVSPSGEASIRRALFALASDPALDARALLAPLARAVGLDVLGSSGDPSAVQ